MEKTLNENKSLSAKTVIIVLLILKSIHQRFTDKEYLIIGFKKDIHVGNYDFKILRIQKMFSKIFNNIWIKMRYTK